MKKNIKRMTHYEREQEFQKRVNNDNIEENLFKAFDREYDESLEDKFPHIQGGNPFKLGLVNEFNSNEFTGRFPDSFQEMKTYESFLFGQFQILKDVETELRARNMAIRAEICYQMYMFYRSHKRVYRIYDGFIDVLNCLKDDWRKTIGSFIRLPHKSIYIPLPPSVNIVNKNKAKAIGVYITWLSRSEELTEYKLLFAYEVKNWDDIDDEHITNISLMIHENHSIGDAIDAWENMAITDTDFDQYDDSIDNLSKCIELIFKTIIYVSSINADIELQDGKKHSLTDRQIRRKINKLPSSLPSYVVGGSIIIKPIEKSTAYANGGGTKHRYKHLVRGHFHNFWMNYRSDMDETKIVKYGEQWTRQENKALVRKFVQPYWKGKDLGDIILKDYIIEG